MRAFAGALASEARKLLALPGIWIAIAIATIGSACITAFNAMTVRSAVEAGDTSSLADTSAFEAGFAAVPIIGVVGAIVIGSLAIGSEYTTDRAEAGGGRQIATTLAATPRRVGLYIAKALNVCALTAALAVVSIPGNYALARELVGDAGVETVTLESGISRAGGAALYWALMALIAFAITGLARSVMVPLTVLIANGSLVSFSLLMRGVTPLADYLPDMAGRNLFGFPPEFTVEGGLAPIPGAIVMACWALGLLLIGGIAFQRRDA
ncbi:ABC transporter permease [Leucobacter sp. NPDC015123]|uniref:ABC transporter permease n=1 Tax=Leucobacter sp. NPDC015123 TaxID=3364129 RepID=UPI0036F47FAF